MKLEKVTITGADAFTDISDLVAISKKYPFVEWGILVSKSKEGNYFRYPTFYWIEGLLEELKLNNIQRAVHICGEWARDLAEKEDGHSFFTDRPTISKLFDRYQINYHHDLNSSKIERMLSNISPFIDAPILIPVKDFSGLKDFSGRAKYLYDVSGGCGVVPSKWIAPPFLNCGYAGGMGPHNIENILEQIDKVCPSDYVTWIDMETKVRVEDDSKLDLTAVEKVLEVCKAYVG